MHLTITRMKNKNYNKNCNDFLYQIIKEDQIKRFKESWVVSKNLVLIFILQDFHCRFNFFTLIFIGGLGIYSSNLGGKSN